MPKFEFIGWCRDEEHNHDKVWGIIYLAPSCTSNWADTYVSFWGRRGKKLSTKIFEDSRWNMEKMYKKKENSGYLRVDEGKLTEVYPEFEKDLSKTAFWATFKI